MPMRMLVGSEGTLAFSGGSHCRCSPCRRTRPRRVPLPDASTRHGRATAYRQARPGCGGAGRPHDDRIWPRDIPMFRRTVDASSRATRMPSCWSSSPSRISDENLRVAEQLVEMMADWVSPSARGRGHRPGLPESDVGSAQIRSQHHDVDEGRRQTGLVHRGLRGAAGGPGRLHRPADQVFTNTAPTAPGTPMPRSAACMCARC